MGKGLVWGPGDGRDGDVQWGQERTGTGWGHTGMSVIAVCPSPPWGGCGAAW